MRRLVFLIQLLCSCLLIHAENKLYRFNNMFSISVSDKLELRQDDDIYTQIVNDISGTDSNRAIVFQQKNLSKIQDTAFEHYCRILIMSDQDETCPYPSSVDKEFSSDDLKGLIATADGELGPDQQFIDYPTASIATTRQGSVYIKIHYTRTGIDGAVNVDLCYFFNYDSAVKAIFSYKESEATLWKDLLTDAMNSFTWNNPYIMSNYDFDHNNEGTPKTDSTMQSNRQNLWIGIVVGIFICLVLYSVIHSNKHENE